MPTFKFEVVETAVEGEAAVVGTVGGGQGDLAVLRDLGLTAVNKFTLWSRPRPSSGGRAPSGDDPRVGAVLALQDVASLAPVLQGAAHPVLRLHAQFGPEHRGAVEPLSAGHVDDGVVGTIRNGAPDLGAARLLPAPTAIFLANPLDFAGQGVAAVTAVTGVAPEVRGGVDVADGAVVDRPEGAAVDEATDGGGGGPLALAGASGGSRAPQDMPSQAGELDHGVDLAVVAGHAAAVGGPGWWTLDEFASDRASGPLPI